MFVLFAALSVVAILLLAGSVVQTWLFDRYVSSELARPLDGPTPFASVLLPCKGLDPELPATLAAVQVLDYPHYEIICAVESDTDPAYDLIQRTIEHSRAAQTSDAANAFTPRPPHPSLRCVIAGCSTAMVQKIANHLAAIEAADPRSEAFAFLDSDSVPHRQWLRAMTAPLADPEIGAVTGFRWYVPDGTLLGLVRCVWNALAINLLVIARRTNFVWGGSVAMRRETFEKLRIAERWRNVLSEDFEITRAVREAGQRLYFTPRVLIPNHDHSGWGRFWRFARRQLIITRVCAPPFWISATINNTLFVIGFWSMVVFAIYWMVLGPRSLGLLAFSLALVIYLLAMTKGAIRHRAVRRMLPDPALHRGVWAMELFGGVLLALFNVPLLLAAGVSSRFWWRDVHYDMRSVDDVRILNRRG